MKPHRGNIPEVHVAVIGANQSGKSALVVRYMTKRYINEYDPFLENTYCKLQLIRNCEHMVWVMDTVEGPEKDPNRYLGWADVFVVVYNITNRASFEYAESLLKIIEHHEHSLCSRQHSIFLVGNKSDLERYRQVSKTHGMGLAAEHSAEFFETNCTEDYAHVLAIFNQAIEATVAQRMRIGHSPSPRPNSYSDSEKPLPPPPLPLARARTKSPNGKTVDNVKKSPTLSKKNTSGLKLFKLFQ